jgi:hypothetical protein
MTVMAASVDTRSDLRDYLPGNGGGITSRVIDSPISASQNRLGQPTQRKQERTIPMQDIVQRYIASWNETDPERRRKLVDELWDDQASYIDPLAEAHGRDAIDAVIAAAQAQFPGFAFTLNGPVDAHHRQARFTWALGPADADPVVTGFDVAVVTENGRLRTVLGFLDQVPT